MLIGVLSDTHGWLPQRAYAELADCGHIIHAGDICDPGILDELRTLADVTAVLGNNDYGEYGAAVGRFARPVIGGVRFLVAHTPRDLALALHGGLGVLSYPRGGSHAKLAKVQVEDGAVAGVRFFDV